MVARTQTGILLNGRPYGLPESLRVAAVPGQRGETVIAAVSYNAVHDTLATVAHVLLFGTPALLLLMIWGRWLIAGSTLRPITALRRGAEQVTATGVPRGLPVPEARDEVHSLAVTLNDMLSRLEAAQQRQRQFVSDTAHELRSPIASIRAQLKVALDHPDGQEWSGRRGTCSPTRCGSPSWPRTCWCWPGWRSAPAAGMAASMAAAGRSTWPGW